MRKFLFAMMLGAGMAKVCSAPKAPGAAAPAVAVHTKTARARVAGVRPTLVKLKEPDWIKNPPHYDAAFLKVKPAPPPAWMRPKALPSNRRAVPDPAQFEES